VKIEYVKLSASSRLKGLEIFQNQQKNKHCKKLLFAEYSTDWRSYPLNLGKMFGKFGFYGFDSYGERSNIFLNEVFSVCIRKLKHVSMHRVFIMSQN
jgi:hypothetical protein